MNKLREIKLGSICRPRQWTTIGQDQLLESGYPVYGANGRIGYYHSFNHAESVVAITCRGATCGEITHIPPQSYVTENAMCPDDMDETKLLKSYAFQALRHFGLKKIVSGSAQPQIIAQDIRAYSLPAPPIPEQRKIADILNTWDEALEKLDALIAAKDRHKKALMQRLLTGKRRIEGSKGPVKFRRASELFTNRSERNSSGLPILSVTQDQGVVLRSSLDRRITHDEETNATYKIVRKGDFVISLRSFQGGLEYSEIEGAVSPAYHIIHPVSPISERFYRHYFKSPDFIGRLAIAVIGIRDGKQISFTDFGFIRIPYLHPEDQQRIAALLDTCDAELDLLRRQRDALDLQKRGLMQRLLTGRIRVKTP